MQSLEQLLTVDGILIDKNNDKISEGLRGHIYIPENASYEMAALAIELVARIGYESVALDFPLLQVYSGQYPATIKAGSVVLVNAAKNNGVWLKLIKEKNYVEVSACSDREWYRARRWVCGAFPSMNNAYSLCDLIASIQEQVQQKAYITTINLGSKPEIFAEVKVELEHTTELIDHITLPHVTDNLVINETPITINYSKQLEEDTNSNINFHKDVNESSSDLSNLLQQNSLLSNSLISINELKHWIIDLAAKPSIEQIVASAHIAARFFLESTTYKWPVVLEIAPQDQLSLNVQLNKQQDEASLTFDDQHNQLNFSGSRESIGKASLQFCKQYPQVSSAYTLQDLTIWLNQFMTGKNAAGEVLRVIKQVKGQKASAYLTTGPLDKKLFDYQQVLNIAHDVALHSIREPREVMSWQYQPKWEVDKVKNLLKEQLYSQLKLGDKVKIKVLVSEEKSVRDELNETISNEIIARGAKVEVCHIYRAYKQALCWLLEDVVPTLNHRALTEKVAAVRIGFRPFLPEGQTEWHDESGATPTLSPGRSDDPNKFFDLPTRLLQELYPADDLLALELPITRDDISFYALEDTEHDYKIECADNTGAIIYDDVWSNKFSERPYLDAWPSIGKVHPNTGWVQVILNDHVIIDERIKTDLEEIWNYYQQNILHDVQQYILDNGHGELAEEEQPFFKELQLQISASEPDFQLPTRKDLISTLDALHEDIYFIGLDFFRTMGMRYGGVNIREPGLILPKIQKVAGEPPTLKAVLYAEQYKKAGVLIDENYTELTTNENINLTLKEICFLDSGLGAKYEISGDATTLESYLDTWLTLEQRDSSLLPAELVSNLSWLQIVHKADNIITKQWNIPLANNAVKQAKTLALEDIAIPTHEVIGTCQNDQIISELARVPQLHVYEVAQSYQGRKIHAIEIKHNFQADVISRHKLINSRPCFMLNHRHHANEVSATNSAYTLIKELLTSSWGEKYLRKLNIVIIPFENADGGAVHYDLMQDNPEWKLHVARYNSVGKEIAHDYFNNNSQYGECYTVPRLYRRWLPDAFVDNHGVPSHEWNQQFAGYVSPWFKGFWLPRALFYGYFWYADDPEYAKHRQITERVAKKVSEKLNNDSEITEMNLDWQNRFEKYAHQWLPKLFPADYRDNLIYYWIPFKPSEQARHFAPRFPELTVLDWTTEVSDETAQGAYLEQCSRALTISDIATMDILIDIPVKYNDQLIIKDNMVYRSHQRVRPIGD